MSPQMKPQIHAVHIRSEIIEGILPGKRDPSRL